MGKIFFTYAHEMCLFCCKCLSLLNNKVMYYMRKDMFLCSVVISDRN